MFRPFDPDGDVRVYVGNLPHWRQPGATYFVTFRQDDSIPAGALAEWLDLRERWYRAHALDPRWQESAPRRFDEAYHGIPEGVRRAFEREQARWLHEELDRCHGSCVLRHAEPQQVLSDSLVFFDGSRVRTGDFVIMPNHVHALVTPLDSWDLEDWLGSVKKWTSRRIGPWLSRHADVLSRSTRPHNKPRFWQHESYDRIVRDAEELAVFRRYVGNNPTTSRLRLGECAYHPAPWLDAFAPRPTPP